MCKKAYIYFVGVTTYAFDGFEKSINETEKTIVKGRQKFSRRKNKSQEGKSNTNQVNYFNTGEKNGCTNKKSTG